MPQTPLPQQRLPAAGGMLPREKTFCAATRPSPVRSRQPLPSFARFREGTSSRRSGKLRLSRVLGRARVPLVPQTPPPQRRLPAAGGTLPREKLFRSLLRGRVLSAPGSRFRFAPVLGRARVPLVPQTPPPQRRLPAAGGYRPAKNFSAACYAAESCPLPAAASVSRRFWGWHESQRMRKAPSFARFREGHEFHSCRKRRLLNGGFQPLGGRCPAKRLFAQLRGRVLSAPGSGFRLTPGSGKARVPYVAESSVSRGFWEGHEFHSCRKRRLLKGGFQPLGGCCPAKRLFAQLRGRVLSAPGSRLRLAPVPGRYEFQTFRKAPSFAGFREGHSRGCRKIRLARVPGRARVPLVPQTPPPQRRLPAAGGMLPCEKTFCAATRPSPVRSRQRLPRVRRAAGAATCAGR